MLAEQPLAVPLTRHRRVRRRAGPVDPDGRRRPATVDAARLGTLDDESAKLEARVDEAADDSTPTTKRLPPRLGAALAEVLPDGTTVALCGTLGAGKTRLVQAIAEAVGVDRRNVTSPTFVLIQEYHGRRDALSHRRLPPPRRGRVPRPRARGVFRERRAGAGRMGRPRGRLPAAGARRRSASKSPARNRGGSRSLPFGAKCAAASIDCDLFNEQRWPDCLEPIEAAAGLTNPLRRG